MSQGRFKVSIIIIKVFLKILHYLMISQLTEFCAKDKNSESFYCVGICFVKILFLLKMLTLMMICNVTFDR